MSFCPPKRTFRISFPTQTSPLLHQPTIHPTIFYPPRDLFRCRVESLRSVASHINNKVKRLALLSVLSDKAANGNMVVVDKFACDEYKTKTVVAMLNAVGAGKKNLLVNETVDAKFVKSAGNIAGVKTTFAGSVNTYDVLNADKLIISVDAAKKLEEVLG